MAKDYENDAEGSQLGEPTSEVRAWRSQLENARKREKDWRKDARAVVALYEAEKRKEHQFNILFSNTETMAPALYNNTPRPLVKRRYKDDNPMGRVAAQVTQRTLEFLMDSGDGETSPFDDMMKSAVLEALLPGRGLTRFKYDATFETEEVVEGEEPAEKVASEYVCGEEVPWDRFLHGYAKKWKDVPWIAFEHFFSREELKKNFGEELANRIPCVVSGGTDAADDEDEGSKSDLAEAEGEKFAHVWEIWDKEERKVLFLAEGYPEIVKSVDDPLGLSGFWPIPRPLNLIPKVSSLVPTPLYSMYEEQAKELNYITLRINKVMHALKVRGFYDSTLGGLEQLMQSDDNVLLPATNVAAMLQGQTLERAIWFFPLEKLVAVLQQLYQQRESVKQVIYEISGISDILRGSSAASETATAQNIKNQWGTLRLKRAQKEVSRYARDCLRIMAEIAVTKLSPQMLAQMTGLPLPTAEQKQQAQGLLAQAKQAAAQAQAMQMPGMPPAPPPPPPPEELLQAAQSPAWEEIQAMLANDLLRAYHIDIETNSTVDIDATEDKQNVGEFTNAFAQLLNGLQPMVTEGYLPFPAAKAIMLAVAQKYRFGVEVEEELGKMVAPPPKEDPKAQADKAKIEMEMKRDQEKAGLEMKMMQAEMQIKEQELELKRQELQVKQVELNQKLQFSQAQHQMQMQMMAAKAAMPQPAAGESKPSGDSNADV